MVTEADPKLTKADFDAEQWEGVLAAANEPTCSAFCAILKAKADECRAAGQTRKAEVYTLLHALATLCLSGSGTNVFRPAIDFGPSCRSATLDDFDIDEASILAELAPSIVDPEFRARVADVAWVLKRDYRMARLAIASYIASAIRLEKLNGFHESIERLRRAAQLAVMLGGKDNTLASVAQEIERIIDQQSQAETRFTCADLMRLLIEIETGDSSKYAAICEILATRASTREDWIAARTYWMLKAEWHRLAKDAEAQRSANLNAAETYVSEADAALKRPTPSHGACAGLLMRAVEALRKIPKTKARVDELHGRILKEQELVVPHETTTHSVSTDISEIVTETITTIRSKPLNQALTILAMLGAPPSVAKLKASAEESMRTNIWSQIIPTVYISPKGKHLAEKPSAMHRDQDTQNLCLKAEMMERIKLHHGLMVSGRIKPALHVINTEHCVRLQHLEFLVQDNPFIPPGREMIFIRGFFAGLSGDFLAATSLLVPQVENSLRYLLYNQAGEPRTSKLKGDLTQPERDLNELLYHEGTRAVLGENLLFDLQSLLIEPGFGANLRNELAHGLLESEHFSRDEAIYTWWLLWHFCAMPSIMRLQAQAVNSANTAAGSAASQEQTPSSQIG